MNRKVLVLTGPSGVGAGSVVSALFARRSDLTAVTPVTARKLKEGETDGVGFYFYDLDGWNALRESGDLLETTEFAGNDYGTSRRLVKAALAQGKHVLLNLGVERAAELKKNLPEAVCVYLEPSPEVLRERCDAVSRSPLEAEVRLEAAAREREMSSFCDIRLCSDDDGAVLSALDRLLDGN